MGRYRGEYDDDNDHDEGDNDGEYDGDNDGEYDGDNDDHCELDGVYQHEKYFNGQKLQAAGWW